jgi:foldase protein PrsA
MSKSKTHRHQKYVVDTDFTQKTLIFSVGLSATVILVSILLLYISSPPEKIYAAKVGSNKVMLHDYQSKVQQIKKQYQMMQSNFSGMMASLPSDSDIEKQALDTLINKEVYLLYAEKNNIEVSDEDVQKEFDDVKTTNFKNDEDAFRKALQVNQLTASGFKDDLRKNLLSKKVQDQIVDERVKISDKDKKDYYEKNKSQFGSPEKVKAKHILVKDEKTAKDLISKINSGSDFDKLAKEFSTDTGSKDKGGDLGFFTKGQMVPEFENATWSLKNEQMTNKAVKSQFGYHIIKRTGFEPAKLDPFKKVEKDIITKIKDEQKIKILESFIKEEKENIKITTYAGPNAGDIVTKTPSLPPQNIIFNTPKPSSTITIKTKDQKVEKKDTKEKSVK